MTKIATKPTSLPSIAISTKKLTSPPNQAFFPITNSNCKQTPTTAPIRQKARILISIKCRQARLPKAKPQVFSLSSKSISGPDPVRLQVKVLFQVQIQVQSQSQVHFKPHSKSKSWSNPDPDGLGIHSGQSRSTPSLVHSQASTNALFLPRAHHVLLSHITHHLLSSRSLPSVYIHPSTFSSASPSFHHWLAPYFLNFLVTLLPFAFSVVCSCKFLPSWLGVWIVGVLNSYWSWKWVDGWR